MTGSRIIGIAAGGTGGHMFPAQALAEEMKQRGWRVILFTDERGMRYGEKFPADEVVRLAAATPSAAGVMAKLCAVMTIISSMMKVRKKFKQAKPAIIVGFGGYPSVPTMLAARFSAIPYGLHEQNAILGRANRLLAGGAQFIAHAFSRLERLGRTKAQILETGNPVRQAIKSKTASAFEEPKADQPYHLLVFGGSQGAALFSRIVPEALSLLPDSLRLRIRLVQQVRSDEEADVRAALDGAGVSYELAPFFADMPDRLAWAHLVIARAGASTVTEIATIGRSSILVPLGIAMDDHQTVNAEVLVEAEGAVLVQEGNFTAQNLAQEITQIIATPGRLTDMASRAQAQASDGPTVKLADLVETHSGVKNRVA